MPIWFLDNSSLISFRSLYSRDDRRMMLTGLTRLVGEQRLFYPREMVTELGRYAGAENEALDWAKECASAGTIRQPSYDSVVEVLAAVPEVLDVTKEGAEEADPYLLAMALESLKLGEDARIVTEEFKTTVAKMCLGSAAGFLRIPSVSLRTMLKFEGIRDKF